MTDPTTTAAVDTRPRCPNCLGRHVDMADVCMLSAAFGVIVHSRQDLTLDQARERIAKVSADAFWDDVGPILDRLTDGYYDEEA
jgi:hypothetical protein